MRFDDCELTSTLVTQLLGRHAVLLSWDGRDPGEARRLTVRFGGVEIPSSRAATSLRLLDRGERHLLAVGLPPCVSGGDEISVCNAAGVVLASGSLPDFERSGDATLNVTRLLQGCTPAARLRFARFVIDVAGSALRIEHDRIFIANVRMVLEALCRAPGSAQARAEIGDRWILCDGMVQERIGERLSATILDDNHVRALAPAPALDKSRILKGDRRGVNFLLPRGVDWAADDGGPTIVLFGERGLVWRRIQGLGTPMPSALAWLAPEFASRRGARRYVLDMLARDRRRFPNSGTVLRELELASGAEGARELVGLSIESAIGTSAGLFVAGRIADRQNLAAAIEFAAPGWTGATTISGLHTVPPECKGDAASFVALIAGEGVPPIEARIGVTLRLASGTNLDAGTILASLSGPAASQAIAAAMPPSARSATLAEVFMPALDAIRSDASVTVDRIEIGEKPGAPRAEIVIAYPDDATLRAALFSSLAVDPAMREMVIAIRLHPSDDAAAAERALRAAQDVYGLAFRLYVPVSASDEAECLNAIVAQGTADHVILVDRGLLPSASGWATGLLACLEGPAAVDAACGMILDSDGTIRHAGYALSRVADGLPELDQPLAGFPAGLMGAGKPATADALPAACLALRRKIFLQAGGFASGYLTQAYRNADLSLRLRSSGADLACISQPAMTAFGPDATDSASHAWRLYDRHRFARSWSSWLNGESGDATPAKPDDAVEPIVRFRRRRWAA